MKQKSEMSKYHRSIPEQLKEKIIPCHHSTVGAVFGEASQMWLLKPLTLKNQPERISTATIDHTLEALKRSYCNLKTMPVLLRKTWSGTSQVGKGSPNPTAASVEWTSSGSRSNSLWGDTSNCPSFGEHPAFVNQIKWEDLNTLWFSLGSY